MMHENRLRRRFFYAGLERRNGKEKSGRIHYARWRKRIQISGDTVQ